MMIEPEVALEEEVLGDVVVDSGEERRIGIAEKV